MTEERRLELLNVIYEAVRESGDPASYQMDHPAIRDVDIQLDKQDWIKAKAAIEELETART